MGWGAGLLGEAFGGFFFFIIVDMVSDAASYDVGFGDADGFNFWGFFFLRDNWDCQKKLEPDVE